jgi:hypothetical protein
VERSFGVLKKRFYALGTILRVRDVLLASKIIECGCILHNLTVKFCSQELQEDLDDFIQDQNEEDYVEYNQDHQRERRRNQLLNFFTA